MPNNNLQQLVQKKPSRNLKTVK
uniref:Uncharacterized protein n=1 Tax=Rhizophora mucronata TaxID=61149 RepID=A0A2P2K0V9_RHIMU